MEMRVGLQVRGLRQAAGLSQQFIAQEMTARGFGWRQTTVSKTEAADRPLRVDEAAALADLLDVPLSTLFSEDDARTPTWDELRRMKATIAKIDRHLSEVRTRTLVTCGAHAGMDKDWSRVSALPHDCPDCRWEAG